MIPDKKNPLPSAQSTIIEILSRKPRLSIKELYSFFIKKSPDKMSLRGFYKIIHGMIYQRILIRDTKLLSIDAGWIYNLLKLSRTLEHVYFGEQSSSVNILLHEGEEKEFIFDRVIDMDNFWTHALIVVTLYYAHEKHTDKHGYTYTDHSWFQLVRTSQEEALLDVYKEHNMKLYQVCGSDTFLDSLPKQMIEYEEYIFVKKFIPEFGKNYYAMSIGDFLFETRLPKYIHEIFENQYKKIRDLSEFNANDFLKIIQESARTTLSLTRNKKRTSLFRKKVQECF